MEPWLHEVYEAQEPQNLLPEPFVALRWVAPKVEYSLQPVLQCRAPKVRVQKRE